MKRTGIAAAGLIVADILAVTLVGSFAATTIDDIPRTVEQIMGVSEEGPALADWDGMTQTKTAELIEEHGCWVDGEQSNGALPGGVVYQPGGVGTQYTTDAEVIGAAMNKALAGIDSPLVPAAIFAFCP